MLHFIPTRITTSVGRIASAYLLFLHIFHVSRKIAVDLLSHQSQWNHLILIVSIFLGGKKDVFQFRGYKLAVAKPQTVLFFSQKCCEPFEFDNLPQFSQAPPFSFLDSTLSTHLLIIVSGWEL